MHTGNALDRRRNFTGYAFVTPTVLVVVAILVYPILQSFVLSIGQSSIDGSGSYKFVGLKHYVDLLHTGQFWNALAVTLTFTGLSIPFELILGIGLALLMNEHFHGKGIARLAVLFPWALPTALNALIWRWMYNSDYGLFNSVALQAGLVHRPINWLGDEHLAMMSMVIVAVWKTSSFMALIILAGLQAIPRDLYEAGRMDGMNRWNEFRQITLPLLRGPILVALVLRSMDALRTFELPFNLTDGGPVTATESLSLYAYKVIFSFLDFNFGAAIVVVQFLVIFAMSVIYILALRARD